MTRTRVEERDFSEIEFPLTIKVCVSPGFNDTMLREVGYDDTFSYFLGLSRFNQSFFGWAGHTNTLDSVGNVSSVLDMVKNHTPEDVIEDAHVWTTEREHVTIPIDQFRVSRVNYPHNCYTLDLFNLTEEHEVKELFIQFHNLENKSAEVLLRDTSTDCNREVKDHSFSSTGDAIKVGSSKMCSQNYC